MYFTDSPTAQIMACDYDAATGEIDRIHVFAQLDQGIEPDGSTIDAEGFLWNAQWGGSRVLRYAPDGRVDAVIDLPCASAELRHLRRRRARSHGGHLGAQGA